MYELIVNLIKFLMRLYMNKIINEEVIESLEGLLVPVRGWRSAHVTTSGFGFLDVFIELSDNYIINCIATVLNEVISFNSEALPFTCSTTDASSDVIFDR